MSEKWGSSGIRRMEIRSHDLVLTNDLEEAMGILRASTELAALMVRGVLIMSNAKGAMSFLQSGLCLIRDYFNNNSTTFSPIKIKLYRHRFHGYLDVSAKF